MTSFGCKKSTGHFPIDQFPDSLVAIEPSSVLFLLLSCFFGNYITSDKRTQKANACHFRA
jgi:hypothetical protein